MRRTNLAVESCATLGAEFLLGSTLPWLLPGAPGLPSKGLLSDSHLHFLLLSGQRERELPELASTIPLPLECKELQSTIFLESPNDFS